MKYTIPLTSCNICAMFLAHTRLLIAAIAFITTLLPQAESSELTVEVIDNRPSSSRVHIYNEHTSCSPRTIPRDSRSYEIDKCHKLDPFTKTDIQIIDPVICANGTRAIFTVSKSNFCNGLGSASMHVSDNLVGECINVRSWRSFAFVCEGIREESGTAVDLSSWISPWTAFLLIVGSLFLSFCIGVTCLFCGGFVVMIGGLGLFCWGLFSLGKGVLVSSDDDWSWLLLILIRSTF